MRYASGMDILNYIKTRLDGFSPPLLRALAVKAGVPHGTLQKIKSGETDNPRIRTVQRLLDTLKKGKQ